ncbi:MAG: FtsX-like permease family protein [Actinomycetota bacterium]|nr:FtsX-like permease family protein [Actinomycetota bacterium]
MIALIVVAVLSLPFLVVLATRPLLRTLAVRNAVRRPRETLLVLIGSMLGTAIITSSFVVGDTLNASIRQIAFTQMGPIDELVAAPNRSVQSRAETAIARLHGRDVAGAAPLTVSTVAVATLPSSARSAPSTSGRPSVAPAATLVETSFGSMSHLGGYGSSVTGLPARTPLHGQVFVDRYVARKLELAVGDRVRVYAYGSSRTLAVGRILPDVGVAGFHTGSRPGTLFVAPGTLGSMREASGAAASRAAVAPQRMVAISNGGGVIGGAARTANADRALHRVLAGLPVQVMNVKSDLLSAARTAGKQFTQLFGGIGFFSVLAGVLLLVNIFVMLAEERRGELGMLRAMGMTRRGLVAAFSLEGWLYSLGSAVLGAIAGLGVGWLVVQAAASLFASPGSGIQALAYSVKGSSLATGFGTGCAISLATVTLTSIGIARLNVIRAIRDLPEPPHQRRKLTAALGVLALLGGAASGMSGVRSEQGMALLVGPGVALGGMALVARVVLRRSGKAVRLASSLAAGAVLAWAVTSFSLFPKAFAGASVPVFVAQGVELTAAGVALVSVNQGLVGSALSLLGGGGRNLALRIGLAYPLARRFRTAMTLSMYSLVMFMLVFVTVFSHVFAGQVVNFTHEVGGGFSVQVTSNPADPVPAGSVARIKGVTDVAALSSTNQSFWQASFSPGGYQPWPATTFGPAFVRGGPPALAKRAAAYPTDAAAYRAVLDNPSLAIVSNFFLNRGGRPGALPPQPGDVVMLKNPMTGAVARLHLAAVAHAGFGNALALVSPSTMSRLFGTSASPDTLEVATSPSVSASAVAAKVNGSSIAHGADARTFASVVRQNLAQQEQFFRLMEGYLALGLLVGIAGLGVVMVRAVRERRREIGVLRSIGFPSNAVRRAFLVESSFVATEGIVIGAVLALVTAWRLATSHVFGSGLPFTVPWVEVAALVLATLFASLVATTVPAQQASGIRPALALRTAD